VDARREDGHGRHGLQPDPNVEVTSPLNSAFRSVVFVITMENHGTASIYGNTAHAPFINNTLIPQFGRALNFIDKLPSLPSEPHYIWMEAGTDTFADHMFVNDDPPSAANSTASTDHLVSEIRGATVSV